MRETLASTIARLRHLSVRELQTLYVDAFDAPPRARNKDFLWRRIAWRLQAKAHGGLAESTQDRITLLIAEHDPLENSRAKPRGHPGGNRRQGARMPSRGTVIVREYKGEHHEVLVVENGFQHRGRVYRSLSAIAKAITGAHWNGPLFFGLR